MLEHALSIYPNPGGGHLTISLGGPAAGQVLVVVRAITGQEILRQQYEHTGSQSSKTLDISAAAKGIYFVELVAEGQRIVRSVTVQ
jgi:hypothetical protein